MSFDPALPDDSVNVSQGSILKEAGILLAGVCLVVALLAVTVSLTIEFAVASIPPGLESRIFGNTWSGIETLDESPHSERLQALTEQLTSHDEALSGSFRVAVIESEHPNAMAFPGGLMVFTTALLDAVETENELAFVVGHELGHYHNRDHLRGLGRGLSWALIATALGLQGDAVGAVATLSADLAQRSFDREQELDADQHGLWLIEQHYGHAGGTRRVFEVLLVGPDEADADDDGRDHGAEAEGGGITRYLDTHPPHPRRIAALETAARERGLPTSGEMTPWPRAPSEPPPEAPEPPDQPESAPAP
jgi:hypothetical protein